MKLNKIFKWCSLIALVISVAILVWGFIVGYESNGGLAVDVLLIWAYILTALAILACVIVGGAVSAKSNPKGILKGGIILAIIAVVCFLVYLLAPAADAVGRAGLDSRGTLKLTDTILYLTYIIGACAVITIIIGEVHIAIVNKQ